MWSIKQCKIEDDKTSVALFFLNKFDNRLRMEGIESLATEMMVLLLMLSGVSEIQKIFF